MATAKALLDRGEFEEAAAQAQRAAELAKKSGDEEAVVQEVYVWVAALVAADKVDAASKIVEEFAAHFKTAGSSTGQAHMKVADAELCCAKGQAAEALKIVQGIKTGATNSSIKSRALKVEVNAHLMLGQQEDAERTATTLQESVAGDSEEMQADACLVLANVHQGTDLGEAKAREAALNAVEFYKMAKNQHGEATALVTAAQAHLGLGELQAGMSAAKGAVELFRGLENTKGLTSALEVVIQGYCAMAKPMSGLQAANAELTTLTKKGNKRGMVDLLEMIAHTHAVLGEPYGAIKSAQQALEIYRSLKDEMGQGCMLHTIAEMKRGLGQKAEALQVAQDALAHFKTAGSNWGQEQARNTISLLCIETGQPSKAPKHGEVVRELKKLVQAISKRDAEAVSAQEALLNEMGGVVTSNSVSSVLIPLFERDPEAVPFLKEQGWRFEQGPEGEGGGKYIQQFPHEAFYLCSAMGGMGFGPQFRVNYPYRHGRMPTDGSWDGVFGSSVVQLPETEAWQHNMAFRPGILDAGLQCLTQMSFQ